MASRSRRKSSLAAKDGSMAAGKDTSTIKSARPREKTSKIGDHASDGEKENKIKPTRGKTPKPPVKTAHDDTKTNYCLCNQPDDGSPMVSCSLCNEWYVFLSAPPSASSNLSAYDLEVYVCPTCHAKTGRRSISECHRLVFHSFYIMLGSPALHNVLR
ncbi:hypothetical protein EDC04DRAFT_3110192 [Pisolithus marmoratus]|nr:hypothetical protein EDC04DRAFT_3110192 [Pisolithus marmoratus]